MTFDDLINPLLDREGGFVSHKADRGAATNLGITQRTYTIWRNDHGGTYKDVRDITKAEAKAIYRANYWDAARCDDVPEAVRDIHFDGAVNYGVSRANKLLQAAAGVTQDGVIGNKTLAAMAEMDGRLLRARLLNERYKFYAAIVKRDRSQIAFIVGWLNRLAEFS
jgi:lysozyme family protein